MQQPTPMFPVMPSFPPTNITTEQIQKYLDENKKLILAILDNQNLGKLAECAQYQAQLQKNLMYLAAIADAQPQTPTMPTQMTPHGAMQQGGFYMGQQAAAAGMTFQPRPPAFNSPHPLQDHHPQQHQNNLPQPQGVQMGLRPMGHNNGMNQNNDTNLVPVSNPTLNDIRKQDKPAATSDNSAAAVHGHGGGDVQEPK